MMEEPNEQKNNNSDWYICCSHSNPETIKYATQVEPRYQTQNCMRKHRLVQ